MLQPKDKTIDGKKVTVLPHPGLRANRLKVRILKLLGGSVTKLLGAFQGDPGVDDKKAPIDRDVNFNIFSDAIELLAEKLEPAEYESLVLECLTFTSVDGKPLNNQPYLDDLFAGNLMFMYKILFFVLEVNFGDFFGIAATLTTKGAASGLVLRRPPNLGQKQRQ